MIADWLFPLLLLPPLVAVAMVDVRTGRIPDAANGAVLVLGLARAVSVGTGFLVERVLDGVIVALLLFLLRLAYRHYRGRQGLGLGDVKFLAAATVWTGLAGLPLVVLGASLAALAGVGIAGLLDGGVGWTTRLRFGPYLAAAFLAVVVLEPLLAGPLGW